MKHSKTHSIVRVGDWLGNRYVGKIAVVPNGNVSETVSEFRSALALENHSAGFLTVPAKTGRAFE